MKILANTLSWLLMHYMIHLNLSCDHNYAFWGAEKSKNKSIILLT